MRFLPASKAASRRSRRLARAIALVLCLSAPVFPQTTLTWPEVLQRFENDNPILKAAKAAVDESKANEVTAYLRPNPGMSAGIDQINPFSTQPPPYGSGSYSYRPLEYAFPSLAFNYLHERQHKRELRRDSARKTTAITQSQYADQERGLVFALRSAFVQVLQAKAVLDNARQNLDYWDQELKVNRNRYHAGDLALLDLNRLELQRVQFETDLQTALVNLRTSKIQLLTLLNERIPVEQFDVRGDYDFHPDLKLLDEYRATALANRPDLKAAIEGVELANINHTLANANGSTDPTFGIDFGRAPPIPAYMGVNLSIPLRIFDRNQGEKERTLVDIGRSEQLQAATRAQVFSDVDSAYWTLVQAVELLTPYKSKYLPLSQDIRDRMAFSYKNGGASLLDFLDAEKSYRDTKLAYLNLIGSYLTAAAQMNMAAGTEVIP
jgi:cobalt-zinc-cadmium efflux system outer membrane protein